MPWPYVGRSIAGKPVLAGSRVKAAPGSVITSLASFYALESVSIRWSVFGWLTAPPTGRPSLNLLAANPAIARVGRRGPSRRTLVTVLQNECGIQWLEIPRSAWSTTRSID